MMDRVRPHFSLLLWLVAIVFLGTQAPSVENGLGEPSFLTRNGEAAEALALEERHFRTGVQFPVLVEGEPEQARAASKSLVRGFLGLRGGRAHSVPLTPSSFMVLGMVDRGGSEVLSTAREVRSLVDQAVLPPVSAYVSGGATIALGLEEATVEELRKSELIALPILLLVLLAAFRSVVAALIPVMFGGLTVLGGFGVIAILSNFFALDASALGLASMVGLAVGVDYSLLMVSRFREELGRGSHPREAADVARRIVGRTVLIAGGALLLAMAAVATLSPGSFVVAPAVGVGAVTIVGALSARVALPPLLAALGHRVDLLAIPSGQRAGSRQPAGLIGAALRRPLWVAGPITIVLLIAAIPAIHLDPQTPGPEILPAGSEPRKDLEHFERALGPGWTAPFVLVAATDESSLIDEERLIDVGRLQRRLERSPAVAKVFGPLFILESMDPLWGVEVQLDEQVGGVSRAEDRLARVGRELLRAATLTNDLQHDLEQGNRSMGPLRVMNIRRTGGRISTSVQRARDELAQLPSLLMELEAGATQIVESVWAFPLIAPALQAGEYGIEYKDEARRANIAYSAVRRYWKEVRAAARDPQLLERALRMLDSAAGRVADQPAENPAPIRGPAKELAEKVTQSNLAVISYRRELEQLVRPLVLAQLQLRMSRGLVWSLTTTNINRLRKEISGPRGNAVDSAFNLDDGSNAARLIIVGSSAPGGRDSQELSDFLQSEADQVASSLGGEAAVGGQGQLLLDLDAAAAQRLPVLILGLFLVTWLALALAFRAILAPLIAASLNVLTVGVAFGALVMLYQGDSPPLSGPGYISIIAAFVVVGVMAGLSIDYEVFMLSRIREEWLKTARIGTGIGKAISRTSRTITSAALVMVGVSLSLCLTAYPVNQQLGIGLIIAILLDATVVRLLLLPALLKICGPAAWWWPSSHRRAPGRPSQFQGPSDSGPSPKLPTT